MDTGIKWKIAWCNFCIFGKIGRPGNTDWVHTHYWQELAGAKLVASSLCCSMVMWVIRQDFDGYIFLIFFKHGSILGNIERFIIGEITFEHYTIW